MSVRRGLFLVVDRGRCGFLSLRDPTTRWSGHPRCCALSGRSSLKRGGVGWDWSQIGARHLSPELRSDDNPRAAGLVWPVGVPTGVIPGLVSNEESCR
jgi:hypothetical protein